MTMGNTGGYGTVSVGATAVLLRTGKSGRDGVIVQNVHATQIVYVGTDANVLTTTGLKVAPGASLTLDFYNGPLYGIADGAATDVRVLESS
jgi:hypothetical protein